MTTDETKAFIESQLAGISSQIKQAKIMQLAWQAGGETFKTQLDDTSTKLGAWLAVEESLKKQLENV